MNPSTEGLSLVAKSIISDHENIIKTAKQYVIPCYVAAVQYGLSPSDYQTALLGLTIEFSPIRKALDATDFLNYMNIINAPDSTEKMDLFTPLFSFPESARTEVRTLKVVFESTMKEHNKENAPSFINVT